MDARNYRPEMSLRHSRRSRGFTLTELMVAVGILLILMAMVGSIFTMASRASSAAMGNNEIMSNTRSVEQKLTQDFRGLLRDSFIGIWHQLSKNPEGRLVRTDRIVFFSAGNFTSVRQAWDIVSKKFTPPKDSGPPLFQPIRAGVARVFYGHGIKPVVSTSSSQWLLTRRAKLLLTDVDPATTSDTPPDSYSSPGNGVDSGDPWDGKNDLYDNWECEFLTLGDWHDQAQYPIESFFLAPPLALGMMVETSKVGWIRRPIVNRDRGAGLHNLILDGCAEFKIQRWVDYNPLNGKLLEPGQSRWYPEEDIDGDGNPQTGESDFLFQNTQNICDYFNGPQPRPKSDPTASNDIVYYVSADGMNWVWHGAADVPKAIKVTVRLFDANNRLKDGRDLTMVFDLK